uniref:Uncharacterized protein n=1 Tax=Glossina pallidipes TaxID=7398 RepID=A0A1B0AJK2_GLOPL
MPKGQLFKDIILNAWKLQMNLPFFICFQLTCFVFYLLLSNYYLISHFFKISTDDGISKTKGQQDKVRMKGNSKATHSVGAKLRICKNSDILGFGKQLTAIALTRCHQYQINIELFGQRFLFHVAAESRGA